MRSPVHRGDRGLQCASEANGKPGRNMEPHVICDAVRRLMRHHWADRNGCRTLALAPTRLVIGGVANVARTFLSALDHAGRHFWLPNTALCISVDARRD